MSDISDVISTSSLLLAVVTALMSFWYAEVTKAIDAKEPNLPGEKATLGKKIAPVLWSKALPLSIGSTAIALVYLPRAISILVEAVCLIGTDWYYDDMKAAFVLTEVLMVVLACVTIGLVYRLGAKRLRMR